MFGCWFDVIRFFSLYCVDKMPPKKKTSTKEQTSQEELELKSIQKLGLDIEDDDRKHMEKVIADTSTSSEEGYETQNRIMDLLERHDKEMEDEMVLIKNLQEEKKKPKEKKHKEKRKQTKTTKKSNKPISYNHVDTKKLIELIGVKNEAESQLMRFIGSLNVDLNSIKIKKPSSKKKK